MPPSSWNCACSVRRTKKRATTAPDVELDPPALRNNPGKSASPFNLKEVPYVKQNLSPSCPECAKLKGKQASGSLCPAHQMAKRLADARTEYDTLQRKGYKGLYFDEKSGGFVAVHTDRIPNDHTSKNDKGVYDKEISMAMNFAKAGIRQELIVEDKERPSFDLYANTQPADYKQTSSAGNIIKMVEHAINHQGAEVVLLEITKRSDKMKDRLRELRIKGYIGYYYYSDMPNEVFPL